MNIILADDDQDDCEYFSEVLMHVDKEVHLTLFKNGKELLDFLALAPISTYSKTLLFLDLNMPLVTGWECLELMKKNEILNTLKTVILSTSGSNVDISKAKTMGSSGYIVKPYGYEVYSEKLRKTLEFYRNNMFPITDMDNFLID